MAGFTTVRDLGTEGAGYADVELKQAIEQGIIPGPRMLVVDPRDRRDRQLRAEGLRARVGPCRRAPRRPTALDDVTRVVRDQIGHGADWIKVYADYRWGPHAGRAPDLLARGAEARRRDGATSAGVPVAVHASTPEGMRRAILAGVETIEHGDDGTPEVFKLMTEHNVALCPTLAAGDATRAVRRMEEGPAARARRRSRASARASRPRSTPASRSSAAATSASSRTATTRASSS